MRPVSWKRRMVITTDYFGMKLRLLIAVTNTIITIGLLMFVHPDSTDLRWTKTSARPMYHAKAFAKMNIDP